MGDEDEDGQDGDDGQLVADVEKGLRLPHQDGGGGEGQIGHGDAAALKYGEALD